MRRGNRVLMTVGMVLVLLAASITDGYSARDGGYDVTADLWAKAVLKPSSGDVTLIWQMVGATITPSGDQVISGYFYADPADFAYGSQYNPEVFVKIYIATSGWCNMAFNHVADYDISIYSAHLYGGTANQSSSVTLSGRLSQHQYNTSVAVDNSLVSPTWGPIGTSRAGGYDLTSEFWGKAVLQVAGSPVTLVWKEVGADTTPSGDQVACGYFYADPNDFAYGSQYNPEAFVKVRVKSDGSADIWFNHVTVDPVSVYSARDYAGVADNTSSITLDNRFSIHHYTGPDPVLGSISITGLDTVEENSSANFTLTANYSDGSSATIASGVEWSVASSYASIGNDGTLTALSVTSDETATITASYGGKSATKTITITDTEMAAQDGGYNVTGELWAKAVLQIATTPVTPVTLVWKQVGADTTPSGDQVISGYFYADPADFAYGSQYNPEVFVKVYIATNGWCNMAFNHVTVDDVTIYSAHNYDSDADQTGTVRTVSRLLEHQYTGVSSQ